MTDKLKELLRKEFPLWDLRGANEAEHHCELAMFHDRKRLHALLDAFDAPAVEAAEIEVVAYYSGEKFYASTEAASCDMAGPVRAVMYVDDHRRILAGVNQQAGSWVPEGWRFSAADFSCIAAGNNTKGYVSLVRDPESRKSWHSMSDELKEADDGPELYVSGYGYTLAEAFADAANKADAAAPLPPSPAAKADS